MSILAKVSHTLYESYKSSEAPFIFVLNLRSELTFITNLAMRILLTIVACAFAYFLVSIGIDYVTGDPLIKKEVIRTLLRGLVFSVIFVPLKLGSRKK